MVLYTLWEWHVQGSFKTLHIINDCSLLTLSYWWNQHLFIWTGSSLMTSTSFYLNRIAFNKCRFAGWGYNRESKVLSLELRKSKKMNFLIFHHLFPSCPLWWAFPFHSYGQKIFTEQQLFYFLSSKICSFLFISWS